MAFRVPTPGRIGHGFYVSDHAAGYHRGDRRIDEEGLGVLSEGFTNYNGVLKVDGEVGDKKAYAPRTYLAIAESAMAERVKRAVKELRGTGTTLFKG
jgi:hypothetical protein